MSKYTEYVDKKRKNPEEYMEFVKRRKLSRQKWRIENEDKYKSYLKSWTDKHRRKKKDE